MNSYIFRPDGSIDFEATRQAVPLPENIEPQLRLSKNFAYIVNPDGSVNFEATRKAMLAGLKHFKETGHFHGNHEVSLATLRYTEGRKNILPFFLSVFSFLSARVRTRMRARGR